MTSAQPNLPEARVSTVTPGNTEPIDTDLVIAALAEPVEPVSELVEGPEAMSIGDNPGVSVALAETDGGIVVVRRHVIIDVGEADAVRFMLESPRGQWSTAATELDAILQGIDFEIEATSPEAAPATTSEVSATTTQRPGGGTGSEDDPFRLPYSETFDPPVDPQWSSQVSDVTGTYTFDVIDEQLVATGDRVELAAPHAPRRASFDFPDTQLSVVEIDVAQSTATAACGVLLQVGDSADGAVIGLVVDSANQRFLTWAPVDLADLDVGLQWTSDSRIRPGTTNQIRLVISPPGHPLGDTMILYVNGEKFTEVMDWSRLGDDLTSVTPGAMFEAGDSVSECRFDNFSVTV